MLRSLFRSISKLTPKNRIYLSPSPRQISTCRTENCSKDIKTYDDDDFKTSALVTRKYFGQEEEEEKNKESFEGAIDIFCHKDTRRRGSVEFIYAAMRNMEKLLSPRSEGSERVGGFIVQNCFCELKS